MKARWSIFALIVTGSFLAPDDAVFAQTLGQGAEVTVSPWRVIAALLLCLGLGVAGAYALKARTGGRLTGSGQSPANLRQLAAALRISLPTSFKAQRRLRVLEASRVSPTLEVCLLSCDGEDYLVAAAPSGILLLNQRRSEPTAETES